MLKRVASAVQLAGLASVTLAAFLVAVPLGLLVFGAALVAVGVALEKT